MRTVALDYSAGKIAYCEVAEGRVVARRTGRNLGELRPVLGDSSAPARVAIEAGREAWFVHDGLTAWGHQVVLISHDGVPRIGAPRPEQVSAFLPGTTSPLDTSPDRLRPCPTFSDAPNLPPHTHAPRGVR